MNSILERALRRLDIGLCWEWQGAKNSSGYGQMWVHGKNRTVHRIVWEMLVGPVPEGLELDHLCRNRKCANPDHLEPVTKSVNQKRGNPIRGQRRGVRASRAYLAPKPQGFDERNPEHTR